MVDIANIVCMKWGNVYGPEYVNKLHAMVSRHMKRPFRFVCFTDRSEGIHPDVEVFDLPVFQSAPLQTKGMYRKKTLCRADLEPFEHGERFLYLDLDVVILSDLDAMFDYKPEADFIICYNWTRGKGKIGNSSVTMMRKGPLDYITQYMEDNFLAVQAQYKTASQEYMSAKVIEKYGHLEFWPEAWCKSFQYHCIPKRHLRMFCPPKEPSADTKIVLFHGKVNPSDAIKGHWPGSYPFWKKWYKFVRPSPWVAKYYQ